MKKDSYRETLRALQVELTKWQRHIIENNQRVLVILEGRDGAGKDSTIKRITKYLSPREVRVVALGKPSDRDQSSWYFQRYVPHLPCGGELVLFNRSWYNRAGVEPVMGFCTTEQYQLFMEMVPHLEQMLIADGMQVFKYFLDISRGEQARRLEARRTNPLKQWKSSPVDAKAQELWDAYSTARNEMLARTSHLEAPWFIVRSDDKRQARLALIRHMLSRHEYDQKDHRLTLSDPALVFAYDAAYLANGMIES
jgi:polyphosphate kinase 2